MLNRVPDAPILHPETRLHSLEAIHEQGLRVLVSFFLHEAAPAVHSQHYGIRMIRRKNFFCDLRGCFEERAGLRQSVRIQEDTAQIVHENDRVRMLISEHTALNLEGSCEELFRFGKLALFVEGFREIVHGMQGAGILFPQLAAASIQYLAEECFGFLTLTPLQIDARKAVI